jgi:hypothetical protein
MWHGFVDTNADLKKRRLFMKTYKVIFAKNKVLNCELLSRQIEITKEYQYVHNKGQLIYAFIRAANEAGAINTARTIVKEVSKRVFGEECVLN